MFDIIVVNSGKSKERVTGLDIPSLLIDSFLWKFRAEKKWTVQANEQLSEEDIVWAPTAESNSIANLVAHIWGTVHSRVEIAFSDTPLNRTLFKYAAALL